MLRIVITCLTILTCPLILMALADAYCQKNWKETIAWILAFVIIVPLVFWSVKTQGLGAVILVSSLLPAMLPVKAVRKK